MARLEHRAVSTKMRQVDRLRLEAIAAKRGTTVSKLLREEALRLIREDAAELLEQPRDA